MKIFLMTLALCLALTACGRRGSPTPPGPAGDIMYPQTYPAP